MTNDLDYIIYEKIQVLDRYKDLYEKQLIKLKNEIKILDDDISKYTLEYDTIKELSNRVKDLDSKIKNKLEIDMHDIQAKIQELEDDKRKFQGDLAIEEKKNLESLNIIKSYIEELKNTKGYKPPVF